MPLEAKHGRKLAPVLLIATTAVLVIGNVELLQADEGSFAQRRACRPDVFRLCSEFIPDHAAITACLERKLDELNPGCRAVFEGRLK